MARLFPPLAAGVHWGLERTHEALSKLGDLHAGLPTVHIGGTNGKGSVATTVASVLTRSGLRTACFTSPHLCSFRERFTVDGRALTEQRLLQHAEAVHDVVLECELTFFEAVTVLGLYAFAREGVEVAVLEVGLGGRLDATNVVTPMVSAVTNVDLDHTDYLGPTLEHIAREKAGIVKPGVPFLTAEDSPALVEVFREVAAERGAPMYTVDPSRALRVLEVDLDHTGLRLRSDAWGSLELRTPLVGRHQAVNTALAVEVLGHLPETLRPQVDAVVDGVAHVVHRGRDEIEVIDGTTWIFDVAHNTAGIASLVDTIETLDLPRPLVGLVAVLGDKDWNTMLPAFLEQADRAVFTQGPTAPPERRWDPHMAAASLRSETEVEVDEDFDRALARARRLAGAGTVVVTGSVHTVGGALSRLGREPLARLG